MLKRLHQLKETSIKENCLKKLPFKPQSTLSRPFANIGIGDDLPARRTSESKDRNKGKKSTETVMVDETGEGDKAKVKSEERSENGEVVDNPESVKLLKSLEDPTTVSSKEQNTEYPNKCLQNSNGEKENSPVKTNDQPTTLLIPESNQQKGI